VVDRSHLSIGEVLSLLREEFPDVTISKIRFLESQGLVDPERTPSGYRKFYDHDVERLRWILRQQREHFLPLKVIKGRLSEAGDEGEGADFDLDAVIEVVPGEFTSSSTAGDDPGPEPPRERGAGPERPVERGAGPERPVERGAGPERPVERGAGPERPVERRAGPERPVERGATAVEEATTVVAANVRSRAAAVADPELAAEAPAAPGRDGDGDDATYTLEELAGASELTAEAVLALQQYGLLAPTSVAGQAYFDGDALAVARAAAGFARHGVEPRHLRAWRNAADREASLFEQVVMPLMKQRNPQARRQAATALEELSRSGGELHAALLRRALRDLR
jgi:DNA-binding transcriptional MerR regulator